MVNFRNFGKVGPDPHPTKKKSKNLNVIAKKDSYSSAQEQKINFKDDGFSQ